MFVLYIIERSVNISSFCSFQNFLVDIKGPALAFLPVLAFEGGTRRNIPKFEVQVFLFGNVSSNAGFYSFIVDWYPGDDEAWTLDFC